MKKNKHSDSLDQKIDALLASKPLTVDEGFAARVVAASKAARSNEYFERRRPIAKLVAFTLPLAAAIAVVFSPSQLHEPEQAVGDSLAIMETIETHEIFHLEESLAALAHFGINDFAANDLLSTLDALHLEI